MDIDETDDCVEVVCFMWSKKCEWFVKNNTLQQGVLFKLTLVAAVQGNFNDVLLGISLVSAQSFVVVMSRCLSVTLSLR